MKYILVILLCFILGSVSAQDSRRLVWEAGIAFDYELLKNYRFNSSLAKRTSFLEDQEGNYSQLSFLEFNQFFTRKLNPILKVSLGYKYRSVDPVEELDAYEHRLTQQAALTHFDRKFRLVSRVRLEQRIRSTSFAHRYRYRLSTDFPLSGEKIDEKEFFLVCSSELLFESANGETNSWENRLSAGIGYAISAKMKADLTFTYRLEDLNLDPIGIIFLNTGLNIKLN